MKKLLVAITISLLMATSAAAGTIKFGWVAQGGTYLQGYKLYEDKSDTPKKVVHGSGSDHTTLPAPTDGKCHAYFLTAYSGDNESRPSRLAIWCPPHIHIPVVQGFIGVED